MLSTIIPPLRLSCLTVVAMLVAGCASRSHIAPAFEGAAPARDHADLYVGQGVGGCVGFYVVDGVVTGGFVLPALLNMTDAEARRVAREHSGRIGWTVAFPICGVTHHGNGCYRVQAVAAQHPTADMFDLVVTEVDGRALYYRMSAEDHRSEIAYSGTAINVDALAESEARSNSSSSSGHFAR